VARTVVDRRRVVAGLVSLSCVAASGPVARRAGLQDDAAADGFRLSGSLEQGGLVLGSAPPGSVAVSLDGVALPLADDGRFLFGLDRDAPVAMQLSARLRSGRVVRRPLAVAPRAWNISRLPTLARVPVPDAEFARRRPAELAAIAEARAGDVAATGWRQPFRWPLTGRIATRFGAQRIYAGEPGAYHGGIDIARPTGTPVRAPADGVVTLAAAEPFTLEGRLLLIGHGMGLESAFMHLSRIDVAVGDRVRQGQVVGAVGATGRATGPHLHWGLKWQAARLDPLLVAGPMPAE
jgi:murein DD-endopeptidase MepM/ murein hydrolase activator NlpD